MALNFFKITKDDAWILLAALGVIIVPLASVFWGRDTYISAFELGKITGILLVGYIIFLIIKLIREAIKELRH